MKINIIAADIHKHMVEHSAHGYTQGNDRWGGTTKETITVDGLNYTIGKGDYDCSSSVITAYRKAFEGTKYEGKLNNATYTGNMKAVFTAAGFKAYVYTSANLTKYGKRGAILLNEKNHTGMMQTMSTCSEFLINENGKITGGKVGDQTGNEAKIRNISAYGKGWQYILVPPDFDKPGKTTTTTKTIDQLAQEVIDGKHGNGDARKASLGAQYEAVQKRVNELLAAKTYKVKVTTALLNVRAGAGKTYKINTTVKKNDILVVTDSKKVDGTTWYKLQNGKGWISGKYATKI